MNGEVTLLETSNFVRDLGIYYVGSLVVAETVGSIAKGTKPAYKSLWSSNTATLERPEKIKAVSVKPKDKSSLKRAVFAWSAFLILFSLTLVVIFWSQTTELLLPNFIIGSLFLVVGLYRRRDYLRKWDSSRLNLDVACFLICLFLLI
ncbi:MULTISPECIES: hypothetical protein [unclassified Ruegeria]|uniref:hypothetical protein n=1 Tax=unclassified Ruegeria TaxID=2625375 RepID=UPI001491AE9D|nr:MULTISPECIES: hypothetical protein [unclassified Ruegeria]NOD34050.1 hypothetical protein [Ruegeria sp. HKCCD7296]NOE41074.1 hypothetical protein [Ruegeria sp. HKCCD7319]